MTDRPPGRERGSGPPARKDRLHLLTPPLLDAGVSPSLAERELAAWAAAVEHLHAAGLPAAVPEFPAAQLRRRGIRADWTVTA